MRGVLLKALKRASRFLQKVKSFPANIYLFKLNNRCKISDYVIIMSHTCFRVNLHSVVPWMSRNSLLETGADIQNLSGSNRIRTDNHLVKEDSFIWPNWAVIQWCSVKKVFLETGLRLATLLKRRLWHRCFPVNFMKFLRTPFLQNTTERLFPYKPLSFTTVLLRRQTHTEAAVLVHVLHNRYS